MSLVATSSDPDDPSSKTRTIPLPSRDQVTAIQLHSLLNAANTLNQLLPSKDEYGAVVGPNDGGVVTAVECSLIKICARIDTIVEESERWTLTPQRELESQLGKVYAAHLAVLQTQHAVLLEMRAPHRDAQPALCRLENGVWAAVLGNPQDRENCIMGIGDSPAAALADFDEVFEGKTKNEQKNVVGSGTETTGNPPGGGPGLGADSDETGANGELMPPPI